MFTKSQIFKIIFPLAAILVTGCAHMERPSIIDGLAVVRQKKLDKLEVAKKDLLVALRQHRIIKAHKQTYIWPVKGGRVSSKFGRRWGRSHDGLDIAAKIGTPISAARAGRVIYTGKIKGYGNILVLNHGGGFRTVYAHNDKNLVRRGKYVRQGDVIALLGNSGRSSGPHLHFEIRQGSKPYNPLHFIDYRRRRSFFVRR
ncbi:M23 family metallopeptidase [Bdellovibrionota bacterium]